MLRLGGRRLLLGALASLLAVLAAGCSKSDATTTGRSTEIAAIQPMAVGRTITAVATTTQIADFLRNMGGDRLNVVVLIAAGQDPHEFEPKPEDIQRLNGADIIFKNGAGLESGFRKFLDNVPRATPIVDTSRGIKLRTEGKSTDAHIWHDPQNAKNMVNTIRDGLSRRDPANAAAYQANALAYVQRIDQLDADIRAKFAAVPAEKRKLVTNHDAFGYYVARYGITFVGSVIPSVDSSAEPNPQDTADLLRKIKAQHVCAIFTETSINPKLEEQIAADAGVRVYSNLYGDTLGPPGSDGDTYLKMEATNTKNMVAGMTAGC